MTELPFPECYVELEVVDTYTFGTTVQTDVDSIGRLIAELQEITDKIQYGDADIAGHRERVVHVLSIRPCV